MRWTAIVPLKSAGCRKTRLAPLLSPRERDELAVRLCRHVLTVLARTPALDAVRLLSPVDPGLAGTTWVIDRGRGLNRELDAQIADLAAEAYRSDAANGILVIHPDLPLLASDDVTALLASASNRPAFAPDRHGTGTNAAAWPAKSRIRASFGIGSFRRHCRQAASVAVVGSRPGLRFDLDTPADLIESGLMRAHGWCAAEHPLRRRQDGNFPDLSHLAIEAGARTAGSGR